jgi:hypothetical protein
MSDQGAENFSVSGQRLGAHEANDMISKVGVEFAGIVLNPIAVGAVGSHGEVFFL